MTESTSEEGFPSEDEIKKIGAIADATRRNQWITWSYHRLDRSMTLVTGDADVSWCGFATWASSTAGTFISRSAFSSLIEDLLGRIHAKTGPLERAAIFFLDRVLGVSLRILAPRIIDRVSGAIGAGNQAVFLDIAPPFSRLLSRLGGRPGLDPAEREAFLGTLDAEADENARKALRKAFEAFLDGMGKTAPGERAERVLLANAWIGWVEQTLVQPYIERSMNAPVEDILFGFIDEHRHLQGLLAPLVPAAALRELLAPLVRLLELVMRELSTDAMMQLTVPGKTFYLGEDVPPLAPGKPFPDALAHVASPDLDELLMLLHAQRLEGSAARDWASFDQRMRYIGTLFRSRQQDRSLRSRPAAPA